MSKHICLDCRCLFDKPGTNEVADHTGFDGIRIDVCPVCMSNHIQQAQGLFLPVLDAEDLNGLLRMSTTYVSKLVENKTHTTDATLLQHYTALIEQATQLITKINNAKQL